MRVCQLDISNFRGIQSGSVCFGEFSVLIGQNNSGKTTIIEALALLLGRDRLVRNLTEHDFFGSCPRREDRISIIATITGFRPNEPDHHGEWFRDFAKGCARRVRLFGRFVSHGRASRARR